MVIIVCITVISSSLLYFCFNIINPINPINNSFRKTFIKNELLRKVFKLNAVGDSRYEYAEGLQFTKLKIIVLKQAEENLSSKTLPALKKEFSRVINKPEGIFVEESFLTDQDNVDFNDNDLKNLVKKYPNASNSETKTAVLFIFVLKKYTPNPTFAGLVLDSSHIFLFMDAIKDVSDKQSSSQGVEISTILHEFGHLLGAEHIDGQDCILSQSVENITYNLPSTILTSYCQIDIDEIETRLSY